MTITRRGFMQAILAAGVAPAVVKVASLMPVRTLASGVVLLPRQDVYTSADGINWTVPDGVSAVWLSAFAGGAGVVPGKMISPFRDDLGNIYSEPMAVPVDGKLRLPTGRNGAVLTAQWVSGDGTLWSRDLQ